MSKVLVVEDSAEERRPLTRLLRHEGYEVMTACDAFTAAAMIRNDAPDLVLLDVGIPPMDGLTMLMLLRNEHQAQNVPIFLVTGHADEHTAARAADLGVKRVFVKTKYEPNDLMDAIRGELGQTPAV
jgi:two-component system, OmpR family, alkaline phosphatase synthesis response regulator PhoP